MESEVSVLTSADATQEGPWGRETKGEMPKKYCSDFVAILSFLAIVDLGEVLNFTG